MGWGDEVLITGFARNLYLATKIPVSILNRRSAVRRHDAWLNNPYITMEQRTNTFLFHFSGHRPYIQHKLEQQWIFKEIELPLPDLFFSPEEENFGRLYNNRVIIEPTLKPGASPNKQYPMNYWWDVVDELLSKNYRVAQVGAWPKESFRSDVEMIHTRDIRLASAIIKHSIAYIGHEGGLHHSSAAVRTPAVVIMGGFVGPKQTGYDLKTHRYLTGNSAPCGYKVPCKHCQSAMLSITPDIVIKSFLEVINETSERDLAA